MGAADLGAADNLPETTAVETNRRGLLRARPVAFGLTAGTHCSS